jgi:transposase-like protein
MVCDGRRLRMSTRTIETVEVDAKIRALVEKTEWTAEDAAEVIAAWRASGARLAAFARAHGTHAQRIRNWRDRKLRRGERRAQKEKRRPAMLPVRVVSDGAVRSSGTATSAMEVVISGGRSVKVGADFDAAALTRLLTTLESLPC